MEITGTIVEIKDGIAGVMILRSSACGHSCETCGACAGKEHVIYAENPVGYAIGSVVGVAVPDKVPLGTAFVVYLLPVLAVMVFCILFSLLGKNFIWLGFAAGLLVWGVSLFWLNRKSKKRGKIDGVIVWRDAPDIAGENRL